MTEFYEIIEKRVSKLQGKTVVFASLLLIMINLCAFGGDLSPRQISFFELEHLVDLDLVQIRGFLYETTDKRLVLAEEPNLKSCCVGSPAKRRRQIVILETTVSGAVLEGVGQQARSLPITLTGILHIDAKQEFPFSLENPTIVQIETMDPLSILAIAVVLIILFFGVWKFQNS